MQIISEFKKIDIFIADKLKISALAELIKNSKSLRFFYIKLIKNNKYSVIIFYIFEETESLSVY